MRLEDYQRVAEVIKQPLLLVSPTGVILAVNSAARRLSERVEVGAQLQDTVTEPDRLDEQLGQWIRHGDPVPARLEFASGAEGLRCHADVGRVVVGEGAAVLVCVRDDEGEDRFAQISDQLRKAQREARYRRKVEQEQQDALADERGSREHLERLQTLTSALAAAVTVEDTLEAILTHAPPVVGAQHAVVVFADGAPNPPVRTSAEEVEGLRTDGLLLADAPQPMRAVLSGEPAPFYSSPRELLAAYPDLQAEDPNRSAPYLAAAVPMTATVDAPPSGVLGFVADPEQGLPADDRMTVGIVAGQCAQALDRARLYDTERRFTETLQRALLPTRFPDTDGVDCAVRYLPAAERRAVGGDWYAVVALPRGRVGLAVGDVAGHGPGAATAMGTMRSGLRALATAEEQPAAVLDAFNTFVCKQLPEEMATVAYVVVDTTLGTLTYANAGHLPPLLVQGSQVLFLEDALQPPIGVSQDIRYQQATYALDSRAQLVLYTDGLIERRGESIDLGLDRIHDLGGSGTNDPEEMCDLLVATLVGSDPLADDAAVLVAGITHERDTAVAAPGDGAGDKTAPTTAPPPPPSTRHRRRGGARPEPPPARLSGHRSTRHRLPRRPRVEPVPYRVPWRRHPRR